MRVILEDIAITVSNTSVKVIPEILFDIRVMTVNGYLQLPYYSIV
jgi:hypothetical protein